MRGLADAGFEACTPIQARTLPLALSGRDVAGQARTGTGKTAAFLLAIFRQLLSPGSKGPGPNPRAICIAPTRELAIQIHRDAELLGKHTGLRTLLAYGGVDYTKQRDEIADGVDILIGTPGRLIDYLKQDIYNLRHIEVAVLDEADRMFDLGFITDIRFLFRRMPPVDQRQTLMFSATFPLKVTELAYEHMNDAETIRVEEEQMTTDRVTQVVYYPANREKLPLLVELLRAMKEGHVMVFANTRHAVDRVAETLKANGFNAAMLAGSVPQVKRQKLLKRFREGDIDVLVATDVAARGLHIPDVSHVINYDLPQDAADYVHRIGRTARLGASGDAISFACEDYAFHLPEIEQYIDIELPVLQHDPDKLPKLERPPRRPKKSGGRSGGGGRGGGRGRRSGGR
ncbi:DEAD/DEAH box helicase [Wenzhouxiangella sp. C33]|uniref:ATP-dependent RNA helicase RhlB n=2 Tax=Wenzhouxiangella limi TaxID=2707351 RepID=A0A845V403_9GAMM|nr:DEAD/DEAH box helicase [Wenzhouxiangella limi]NDY97020.1 DEAD/DEAH box helicase [Wenzhouxiangella limi]